VLYIHWGREGRGAKQAYRKRLMRAQLSACSENCGSLAASGLLMVVSQMGGFPSTSSCSLEGKTCQSAPALPALCPTMYKFRANLEGMVDRQKKASCSRFPVLSWEYRDLNFSATDGLSST